MATIYTVPAGDFGQPVIGARDLRIYGEQVAIVLNRKEATFIADYLARTKGMNPTARDEYDIECFILALKKAGA